MSEQEDAINDLVEHSPIPRATGKDKVLQTIRDFCALVAVVTLVVVIVKWTNERDRETILRTCISQSFQQRDAAEARRITGQVKGLEELKRGNQKGLDTFTQATEQYLTFVSEHPLGTCRQ